MNIKLEGSDIYGGKEMAAKEIVNVSADYNKALTKVQELILANVTTIKLSYESEDERRPATMQELMNALSLANTDELVKFADSKRKALMFEDGYIIVKGVA